MYGKLKPQEEKSFALIRFLSNRQFGIKNGLGINDQIAKKLLASLRFNQLNQDIGIKSVLDLEFSPDGTLLVAACEGSSILFYDPRNKQLINTAHANNVNCIKFISCNTFATGSDDYSVKIWDTRNLNSPKMTLNRHTSWITNVQYSDREKRLITSSYDGVIYSWDLDDNTERKGCNKLFQISSLTCMKLSPDSTTMIISTTRGYLILIRNIQLEHMLNDLKEFSLPSYEEMLESGLDNNVSLGLYYLFQAQRRNNRIELISDFPHDTEYVTALDIHPKGWCTATRNVNSKGVCEWTSIHDIQEKTAKDYEDAYEIVRGYQSSQETVRCSSDPLGFRERIEEIDTYKIIPNIPRMTHFVQEPAIQRGFMKELCFSPDGRVICSPYQGGIRLFAYSNPCNDYRMCVADDPQTLVEVNNLQVHSGNVICARFNPFHPLLVSGSQQGEIVWYLPVL